MSTALADQCMQTIRVIRDFDEFARQPDVVVSDVMRKIGWIVRHAEASHGQKGSIATQAAVALGVEVGSFLRYVKSFARSNWRGIMDKRTAAATSRGLHPLTKSWIQSIWTPMQRDDDGMEVWREVIDKWNIWKLTGDPKKRIPGYESCPPADPTTGYPVGLSYDNIMRLRPKAPERALAKHGKKSASIYLPPVLTTRVGSAVLSRRLFDDQDLDNMLADGFLAISGIDSVSRPVSFNCLDFFTGRHVDAHLRLMHKTGDKVMDKTLTGMEFVWFVIKQLQCDGWRTDDLGSEFIFEHGTANTWSNKKFTSLGGHHRFEDAMHAITGGHCYVNRSGKFEGPVFTELCFRVQSSGNFKFKTWIESSFRLLRTYMQSMPGQLGSNQRVNGKEESYGIKLAENNLLTSISSCPDPALQEFLVENFRHELLDLATFSSLIASVYRAINLSTQHKLEGWAQCGLTVPMWRLNENSDNWFGDHEMAELLPDPMERQMILRKINLNREALTRDHRLSRQAAWDICMARDRGVFEKLSDAMVGMLLPREWAHPVTVAPNHTFSLSNPLWPDTRETYVTSWDERGATITLDIGQKLLVYHNPFFDGRAQIHSLDGSYITTLYPTVRAAAFDAEAKLEQLKVRGRVGSQHAAHLRVRLADIGAKRTADQSANRQILRLTREDRKRAANALQQDRDDVADRTSAGHAQDADEALARMQPVFDDDHSDDLDF